jgi:hypothetical protein
MSEEFDPPKPSKQGKIAKLTGIWFVGECLVAVIGMAIFGVAYTLQVHLLTVLVVVLLLWYAFSKWFKDDATP